LKGYDEPEILPSQLSRFCLIGADAGQALRQGSTSAAEVMGQYFAVQS
jgi:hypothetical protein